MGPRTRDVRSSRVSRSGRLLAPCARHAMPRVTTALAFIAALGVITQARANANASKNAFDRIAVDERLDNAIDRELTFTDQDGLRVKLGDYLDGSRPLLLTLNYFRCRTLCDLQLT